MKFQIIYRASFYLMLTFATLVLSIDATDDNPIAMLYPLAVAVASIIAFLTVDRHPGMAPSRASASLVALASSGLSIAEYKYDNGLVLLAAAHWLVYLMLIKMFLPKTVEDDWFLFLLGLVQVLVGGVMSQSDKVGVALFTWALLSLWVLTLFALHREALRLRSAPMGTSEPGADRSEPYRGLIDPPFLLATIRVAGTTLALGGLIFLAMPRRTTMGSAQTTGTVGKHLSGFDDEIQLGQLGEILENDSVVMSVEMFDFDGKRIAGDTGGELRWRGVSLDQYVRGRWRRPKLTLNGYPSGMLARELDRRLIRQMIKMEPTDSPILFSLRPILHADAPDKRFTPEINELDGTLFRGVTGVVTVDYQVDSSSDTDQPQPGEGYPAAEYEARLLGLPDEIRDKLRPVALEQVGHLDPNDRRGRAAALEQFLRDSGRFRYTLQMDITDPGVDPVVDFVLNRRAGHCEYFASALALLLRSIDIPARMVNGFKGGDYSAIAGLTTVRQKHAHSWVEALVGERPGPLGEPRPTWMTLDPSPADQRNESVARVGGISTSFRPLTDFVRYVWVFYIVGFNAERQDRFLYAPIRALIEEARRGFAIIWDNLRSWLHFPSVESFFSLRGFVVSFLALLLLVLFARVATWGVAKVIRGLKGAKAEVSPGTAAILFYRRLLALLAEYGLERPPAETPREFARRAAIFLAGHGSGTEAVADVPPLVVDAFYQIRFGEHTLVDDDLHHVLARLDALEARLHPPKE